MVTFQSVWSPREYNFRNDHINCKIEYTDEAPIIEYVKAHIDAFKRYIKENYTSYDGFASRYSNDVENDGWLVPDEWNAHQWGAILDFVVRNHMLENWSEDTPEFESMYYYVSERIYYGEYVDMSKYEKLASCACVARESKVLHEAALKACDYIASLESEAARKRLTKQAKAGYEAWVNDVAEELIDEAVDECCFVRNPRWRMVA